MIEFKNVTLAFKKQKALDNVSFTLKGGTICGVLGRNGAGKTSLFRLLAAYVRPTSGDARVFGENPYENQRITQKVALITDMGDEYNSFSVRDTLKLAAAFRPNWDEGYAQRLAKRFELPVKKAMSSLSHGQRASVRAVVGLASRCEVTIFDEAYLGMDAAFRKMFVSAILDDFTQNPRTILFSTHFIDEMSKLFNEVLILDKGKVAFQGDSDVLRQLRQNSSSATLQDLFIEITGGIDNEGIS
ncbi:MAG: ABC transporter ATP-binding protein [Oscillospiraceae bacterium]|jgi:ABC-2 type transport system ATP-binding protein|nr:ABC transporter ATP-binding protein [Oscillospiraceae bacterium]